MKRACIVVLLCLNVVLLVALVGINMNKAQGQTVRGANNYLMATGRIEANFDAIYVLDMKTRRLAAWQFDRTAKRLRPFKGRTLAQDFGK